MIISHTLGGELTPPSQLLPLQRSFGAALVSSDLGCGEVIYIIRRRSIASCSSRKKDYPKLMYKIIVLNISEVTITRLKITKIYIEEEEKQVIKNTSKAF